MSASAETQPLQGLSVVEVSLGTSELGLGLAGGLPGMMLGDLGASVTRVVGTTAASIDRELPWGRAWHRDKRIVVTDSPEEIVALLRDADVALVYGPEALIEGRGLGYRDLVPINPSLVYTRCRPSRTSSDGVADYGLLVEADAGFCTQLAGHRPGPIFIDARASGIGAASLMTVSALALLCRRAWTGAGGWGETSLYDGLLATLGCMIGRSERAAATVESYWESGSTFPNFLYRCADGELIQVWFGGKGMYASLLAVLGDEPSVEGYYADQMKGQLGVRAKRWTAFFAKEPRDVWIERLRAAKVACEPVFAPGEALADPHLAEIGLAIERADGSRRDVMVGSAITVGPLLSQPPAAVPARGPAGGPRGVLDGLRVVDFSAYVAGPLAAEILADLGAEVIKVEPPGGEAMRAAAYAIAACQRGKRSIAIDITDPAARPVVERLLGWGDVVLHNFRVGVAERLGIDEEAVASFNPNAVYCHASAFGAVGRRATFPGNDALMQAVTGFEQAIGGAGNEPLAATWIPLDMAGGWVAAAGILAGLFAQATRGGGQRVSTSLLGAGMLMHSGVYSRDGELVRGPELDARQTGYGPGYRIYRGADDAWFALVLPDESSWDLLGSLPELSDLPARFAPLRGGTDDAAARAAEVALEQAFATAAAAVWVDRLRAIGLLAESIAALSRDGFRRSILDDPVNRQLGRVASYDTADWGAFEQIGPLLRLGPGSSDGPRLTLPRVGEQTVEVLAELGLPQDQINTLLDAKLARQLEE